VRRLVLLTAVAALAIAGVAYAITDTVSYSTKLSHKGTPSSKKPANLSYTGILHIDTNPAGTQPETAPSTTVYYSKAIKNNGKVFPFCSIAEIDGQPSIPSKCKKAIVGSGTASALAGSPGQSSSQSIHSNLTVTAMNGTGGKFLMLILNAPPGGVQIQNRVVPGFIGKASGQYGSLTRFEVPKDLQEPVPGIKVALTDFNVKIPGTSHTVKVKGKTKKLSYLQVTSCKSALPSKAVANFVDAGTGQKKTVTSPQTSAKC
jgi:hypothetical protein